MSLYLIGIGLWDPTDITIKGLEAVKRCEHVYLESYTSKLGCTIEDLEALYGKKIIIADRDTVENADRILDDARSSDTALLIIGDIFSATTHIDIALRAWEIGIKVHCIHNTSILIAIGEIGIDLYKFGRTVSIPFHNKNVSSPAEMIRKNLSMNLHSLVLLDLSPKDEKYMTSSDAAAYLLANGFDREQRVIACAGIGSSGQEICYSSLRKISERYLSKIPQCLIIPANLHFMEEKALSRFADMD